MSNGENAESPSFADAQAGSADMPEEMRVEGGFAPAITAQGNMTVEGGGALAFVAGGDLKLEAGGGAALIAGGDMTVNQGGGQVLISGGTMSIKEGGGGIILTGDATVNGGFVGFLLSGSAELGEGTRVLFNTPQSLAFGAAFGLV